ncbi:MAG TPA: GxxExxY protein [Alphaproteobacteria bacterium]|jgi:GxxExxY protein
MDTREAIPAALDRIGKAIVDSAFRVHSELGPGLLESIDESCLAHEIGKRGISIRRQTAIPIVYDGISFDGGLRLDLLAADAVIIEVKSVERMQPVFEAQILSYMKLAKLRLGYLINFNVPLIRDGIKRYVR